MYNESDFISLFLEALVKSNSHKYHLWGTASQMDFNTV